MRKLKDIGKFDITNLPNEIIKELLKEVGE